MLFFVVRAVPGLRNVKIALRFNRGLKKEKKKVMDGIAAGPGDVKIAKSLLSHFPRRGTTSGPRP